jgi:uncharacterized protein
MRLSGKTVVITGASSGIGLELLKLLIREGAKVVAASRSIENLMLDHPNLHKFACDVAEKELMDDLFAFAEKEFGPIDIFIANAGIAYYETISAPDWGKMDKLFATNVFSAMYAAEKLKEIRKGEAFSFVAISSGAAFMPMPGYSLYSSACAALSGFAAAYRWELAENQIYQTAYPIATRTNFFKEGAPKPWPSQSAESVAKAIVKGIKKRTKEIFPSKLFLLLRIVSAFLPFVGALFASYHNKKLHQWLNEGKV